jgi:hypothetical protein
LACPSRWLLVSLTACSCAFAGCGSAKRTAPPPRLPHSLAQRLAHEAEAVAEARRRPRALRLAERLQLDVVKAINLGLVPAPLQEELQGSANALADRPDPGRARSFAAWLRRRSR